jgi:hypothetical protein
MEQLKEELKKYKKILTQLKEKDAKSESKIKDMIKVYSEVEENIKKDLD